MAEGPLSFVEPCVWSSLDPGSGTTFGLCFPQVGMIRLVPMVFRVSVIVTGLQLPGCVIIHKCSGMVDISPLKWTQDSETTYLNCVFNEVYQEHPGMLGQSPKVSNRWELGVEVGGYTFCSRVGGT